MIGYGKSKFQQEVIQTIKNDEDFKNYLLNASEVGNLIQEEIDLQVIDARPNDA